MSTLHIEHPISDFTTWKAAFDRFAPVRLQSGVRGHRIQRPVSDPHYIVLDLDFDNPAKARRSSSFCKQESGLLRRTPPPWPAILGPRSWNPSKVDERHWARSGPVQRWRTGAARLGHPRRRLHHPARTGAPTRFPASCSGNVNVSPDAVSPTAA